MRYTELLLSFPPRYSLLDSFLPDAGVNFDLVILKTWALGLRRIAELLDFCYYLPIFLRNTAKRYSWIWEFVIHFVQLYIGIYVRKVILNYFLRGSVEARSFHCRISYQWSLRRCPYFPKNAHHTFLWIWLFACLFSWNTAVALIVFP